MAHVLLAGESWVSEATHYKGFDSFTSVTFHSGADDYIAALAREGITVEHMYGHDVPERFPRDLASLNAYDVVILPDIGANSFLLPPETWLHGRPGTNRLNNIRDWVRGGGALMMVGGYLSFQGFQAKANFARSPLAEVLPVTMFDYDDRVEVPEGVTPVLEAADHSPTWPRCFNNIPTPGTRLPKSSSWAGRPSAATTYRPRSSTPTPIPRLLRLCSRPACRSRWSG